MSKCSMKGKPAGYRILVKLKKVEEKSEGGIIIASTDTELARQQRSASRVEIMQVGRDAFKAFDSGTMWCEEGDEVLIARLAGDIVDKSNYEGEYDDDATYSIINDQDILYVFDKESK